MTWRPMKETIFMINNYLQDEAFYVSGGCDHMKGIRMEYEKYIAMVCNLMSMNPVFVFEDKIINDRSYLK